MKPDALYWSFDNGLVGHSDPTEVEDGSDNGFTGQLQPGKIHPAPVYAEGKFGTALRFHGVTPSVATENGQEKALNPSPSVFWRSRDTPGASDISRLEMAGRSFTAGLWVKLEKISRGIPQSLLLMNWGIVPESQWSFMLIKDRHDEWIMRVFRTPSK